MRLLPTRRARPTPIEQRRQRWLRQNTRQLLLALVITVFLGLSTVAGGKRNYFENTHSEDQVVSVGKVC